jgi:hypothetical protein
MEPGVNDTHQIDRKTFSDYVRHLRQQGELPIATAQNRLSRLNRTISALRGYHYVKVVSPRKALRVRRTSVRHYMPQSQDHEHVQQIVDALFEHQCHAWRPLRSWNE